MSFTDCHALSQTDLPSHLVVPLPGAIPLELRLIPAGSFLMGERGQPDEEPVHRVTIDQPFYLGIYPLTQIQYRALAKECLPDLQKIVGNLGIDPSSFKGEDRPVEQISWDDANCVAAWLSRSGLLPAGWKATLPSEAQWEYACRAGTQTQYWSGDLEEDLKRVGWFGGNAEGETHPVGEKDHNPFGLFDMHGNVQEWCLDYYDPRRYRKMVEGEIATDLSDSAKVEFDEADPTLVSIAEMLRRFAVGDFTVREVDRSALEAYRGYAETFTANGNKQWETDVQACKAAQQIGIWPTSAKGVAQGTLPVFQNAIEATANREDPACVLRGGAWVGTPGGCRSAGRFWVAPGFRSGSYGCRLAVVPGLSQPEKGPEAKKEKEKEKQSEKTESTTQAEAQGFWPRVKRLFRPRSR